MTVRRCGAIFFALYGLLLPLGAVGFTSRFPVVTLCAMASSFVLAALYWTGKTKLLTVLISLYVFKVYLIRPFVGMFEPRLDANQLDYIDSNNYFFVSPDAAVVYLSLLSLLVAWLAGVMLARPKPASGKAPPWIFRQVDRALFESPLLFSIVVGGLMMLNYRSASQSWQGVASGQGEHLFAFGLFETMTLEIVCLFAFIRSRQLGARKIAPVVLLPPLVAAGIGSAGGGRGAVFSVVVLAAIYWVVLNFEKIIRRRAIPKIAVVALALPPVVVGGLFAQVLRPLLRNGASAEAIRALSLSALDFSDPNNPITQTVYFGVTELLYRMSSLKAQFLILNEHFIHRPWQFYNPLETTLRIVNDLLPGDPFTVVGANQLFDYVYLGNIVTYNSEAWSIQGTMYLYFGLWFSPVVVFILAFFAERHSARLNWLAMVSPAFSALFISVFNSLIENGMLERVVTVEIVRGVGSFLAVIFVVAAVRTLLPKAHPNALPVELVA